jgi:hypothetical protein
MGPTPSRRARIPGLGLGLRRIQRGTVHPDPAIADRARIDLALHRSTYGEGIPFASAKQTSTASYVASSHAGAARPAGAAESTS